MSAEDETFQQLVEADPEGQVAEARACALAVVSYWKTLADGGLPEGLVEELTAQFAAAPSHVWMVEED